jgi:uncharacterized protein (DUF1499 family)
MVYEPAMQLSPLARWSRTVAFFSLQLLVAAILLHRLLSLPTPAALAIFVVALAGAALAVMLAIGSYVTIWRDGRPGVWSASLGLFCGLGMMAWPAAVVPFYSNLPAIHDITTDMTVPPGFVAIAAERGTGANPAAYGGREVAMQQQAAYPDIRPIVVARSATDTWEAVEKSARRLGWRIVGETPPRAGKPGYLEAVDRTLVLGFYDDLVVRVDGNARETRIDVRSASRYGVHDFGRNAKRIRGFLKDLDARLDEAVAGSDTPRSRRAQAAAAVPKRLKDAQARSKDPKQKQGRAQRGSPREPQRKATRPAQASDRARDKQPRRSEQ